MNWDDVRHFLAVARCGSLSAAAKRLAVNHSTVARRVDNLERQLGVRLFDRLASGYLMTQAEMDPAPGHCKAAALSAPARLAFRG